MKLISLLFAVLISFQSARGSGCPLAELISPCTCYHIINDLRLTCRGDAITQASIANAVQAIRGGLDPEDWFEWAGYFRINSTSMESLDLSPFFQTYIERIIIDYNSNLRSLTGPSEFTGRIGARGFEIRDSPSLDDEGLGNVLQYFNPTLLRDLFIIGNNLTGYHDKDGVEIVQGINSVNVEYLQLGGNRISRIKPGSFINMTKLGALVLDRNDIVTIEENAFELSDNHEEEISFSVSLYYNLLNSTSIHPNFGFESIKVRKYFHLNWNQIETVPQHIFEPLLTAPEYTSINVYKNPIICDERVKWLKDNRDKYWAKFSGGDCENDPGFTVFNSNLIP